MGNIISKSFIFGGGEMRNAKNREPAVLDKVVKFMVEKSHNGYAMSKVAYDSTRPDGYPCGGTLINWFGSWKAFIERCGLRTTRRMRRARRVERPPRLERTKAKRETSHVRVSKRARDKLMEMQGETGETVADIVDRIIEESFSVSQNSKTK